MDGSTRAHARLVSARLTVAVVVMPLVHADSFLGVSGPQGEQGGRREERSSRSDPSARLWILPVRGVLMLEPPQAQNHFRTGFWERV